MEFEIQSGIPPTKPRRGRKAVQFPLTSMQVGDSFLIPCDVADRKVVDGWRRKVAVARKKVMAVYECKFQVATVEDGLRVWRTA